MFSIPSNVAGGSLKEILSYTPIGCGVCSPWTKNVLESKIPKLCWSSLCAINLSKFASQGQSTYLTDLAY